MTRIKHSLIFAVMAGIYIHIPFCKQACNYCNFHFSTSLKLKKAFVDALKTEIINRKDYLTGQIIETVYWGGGTPSILSGEEFYAIWDTLQRCFDLSHAKEITLEANPDDLDNEKLVQWAASPVNRLSIGVQSFSEQDLRYMNRAHTAREAAVVIDNARNSGFDALSIDLIYGTPGLTDATWKDNLHKLIDYQVPHISAYALTVEPKTVLARLISKGQSASPEEVQAARQFEIMQEELGKAGYEQYEISNFAQPGSYALHNTNYWRGVPYLGLGSSAHSFNGKSRSWNIANNARYIQSIKDNGLPDAVTEILTETEQIDELIMTSLRTMWGLDLRLLGGRFGEESRRQLLQQAAPYLQSGQMIHAKEHLILTPGGRLFADAIASDLFFC